MQNTSHIMICGDILKKGSEVEMCDSTGQGRPCAPRQTGTSCSVLVSVWHRRLQQSYRMAYRVAYRMAYQRCKYAKTKHTRFPMYGMVVFEKQVSVVVFACSRRTGGVPS